jgi:hypothetical protein
MACQVYSTLEGGSYKGLNVAILLSLIGKVDRLLYTI